jgi:hypothetical protein
MSPYALGQFTASATSVLCGNYIRTNYGWTPALLSLVMMCCGFVYLGCANRRKPAPWVTKSRKEKLEIDGAPPP